VTSPEISFTKHNARDVIQLLEKLEISDRDQGVLTQVASACPSRGYWCALFAHLSLDQASFRIDFGVARPQLIARLSIWCQKFRGRGDLVSVPEAVEVYGFICLLLITLITMQEAGSGENGHKEDGGEESGSHTSDHSDNDEDDGPPAEHDCSAVCMAFIGDGSVRKAVEALYEPKSYLTRRTAGVEGAKYRATVSNWNGLGLSGLKFLRHGSTSFILTTTATDGVGDEYAAALKCVLLPYASISSIADETARYAENYNASDSSGKKVRHMVRVRASSPRWILMDFVPGRTLKEEIERQVGASRQIQVKSLYGTRRRYLYGNVRLDILRRLALPLLTALNELHGRGRVHEDLSPTNIMVEQRARPSGEYEYEFTFIDFGRNYLYARSVSGAEPFQGRYVAPEIRENITLQEKHRWRSDAYSFGRIMITLGDVSWNSDGTVPDRFYAQAPLIARIIEDLIDASPRQRLLVFASVGTSPRPYDALLRLLNEELDATQTAINPSPAAREHVVPFDKETMHSAIGSLIPLSREPRKRRRIYRERKRQGVIEDPRRSFYARWLLGFSVVASASCYVSAAVCLIWFLRDLGIGILNPAGELVYRVAGIDQNWIPIVDGLRVDTYKLGDIGGNLPARIIGFSFALAAARYYQNILGGFTTRVANTHRLSGAWMRQGTEVMCRIMSIWGMPLILACNLIDVEWWPIASAIGYSGVLLSNLSSARFADDYIERARTRRLSTVPARLQKITGLDGYRQWGPSMFFYVAIVWAFALPIYYGTFKDVYVYAIVVGSVNIGLFYVIKTGANALDIRTGLTRAIFAAERLRYLQDVTGRDDVQVVGHDPRPVIGS
jgi:serine/threonine protein kinase